MDDEKVVELSNWAVETIGNGYALREIKKTEYQVNFNYIFIYTSICPGKKTSVKFCIFSYLSPSH